MIYLSLLLHETEGEAQSQVLKTMISVGGNVLY